MPSWTLVLMNSRYDVTKCPEELPRGRDNNTVGEAAWISRVLVGILERVAGFPQKDTEMNL